MGENDTVTHPPGRPPGSAARLYVLVLEEDSSAIVNLPQDGRLVVGRADECDIKIRDRAASRRHAELRVKKGEVEVVDLGSHNGTLVNGERAAATRALDSGDVVTIGEVALVFHAGHSAAGARRLLDLATLRRRLAEEVERAAHFQRPLSVMALDAVDPSLIAASLRPIDYIGLFEGRLVIVFPELGADRLPEVAGARAGVAGYPDDGLDGNALLTAAAAAARAASPGQTASAGAAATRIELGERAILIADPAMLRLFELVKRLAKSELPVLISGETGVGKESAAFTVHHFSRRRDAKFLPLNCAALPDNLLESELFGYEKGAFSGANQTKPGLLELGAGGTVFLDEVGEMSASAQAKMLRVLEEKKLMRLGGTKEIDADIRIVAATNRDLESEIEAGRFRRDLYFRLSGATVVLPPLRDRPRELGILMRAFLSEACAKLERSMPTISRGAMAALAAYAWPGNVRELKNAIEFAAATAEETIEIEHLPERIARVDRAAPPPPPPIASPAPPSGFRVLADEIDELERTRLREALAAANGVKAQAARLIGMPLRTFVAKLKHHGL